MIHQPFKYNAGIVRANGVPFFDGDGTTQHGQLVDSRGNPISAGKVKVVSAIRQTNWQGRRLLSPLARTNYALHSSQLQNWSNNGAPTVTPNATAAPDSTLTATRVESTGNIQIGLYTFGLMSGIAAGELVYYDIFVKHDLGTPSLRMTLEGSAFPVKSTMYWNPATGQSISSSGVVFFSSVALANGWYQLEMVCATGATGSVNATLYAGTTDNSAHFLWGAQIAREAGVYIPTVGASVTVVDTTVADNQVTFGQVPAVGSIVDWDGIAWR